MVFKKFVEIGRVCCINYGSNYGKLCVIIDVIDHNKAFVDGPEAITGVRRQSIPLRWLSLTDLKVKIGRCPRAGTLAAAFKRDGILEKWQNTAWAKKYEKRNKRASLGDFDRFKVMLGRKERSRVVRIEYHKLAKAYQKEVHDKAAALSQKRKAAAK